MACGQIESRRARSALVIGADFLSRFLDFSDRDTTVVFADGAGAALVCATDDERSRIGPIILRADHAFADLIRLGRGAQIEMRGPEVFRVAVARLAEGQMTLTVCPLSNQKLCVVPDLRQHPLKRMLDLGLRATVNSDDPAYFGGYLGDNYRAVAEAGGITRDDMVTLARNSFLGSFLDESEKALHLAALDAYIDV